MSTHPSKAVPFWIVWCPTGPHPPRVRHDNTGAAEKERDRMAREHPGAEFYVMRAESCAVKNDLAITEFVDEIPF